MKAEITEIHNFQTRSFDVSKTTEKLNISEVFSTKRSCDINEVNLFIAHFNAIPNYFSEIDIHCEKANNWFVSTYEKDIADVYYNKRYFNDNKNAEYEDIFFFLYEDLIVDFDNNQSVVRILFRKTAISIIEEIITGIKKFKQRKRPVSKINLLVQTGNRIDINSLEISRPKLTINDNYNDDFMGIHQVILRKLSQKNGKGLVLLHGMPGTGKTSYIRYLITLVKKKVIFLPPNMANAITNPGLLPVLIDNPNSIFVIEDAENIIIDRERDGNSPVSALLNISDGLLSDCLNIQIICSFNTDVSKIDRALMRKGRLIAKYDFQELEAAKANELSKKLGYDSTFDTPMSLSAIYNQNDLDFKQSRSIKTIGFQTRNAG